MAICQLAISYLCTPSELGWELNQEDSSQEGLIQRYMSRVVFEIRRCPVETPKFRVNQIIGYFH